MDSPKTRQQYTPEQRAAMRKTKKLHDTIRQGITPAAVAALKKVFGYNAPLFLYNKNGYAAAHCMEPSVYAPVMNTENPELIKLHAAVRDGQREVISYIERILNPDDE